MMHRSDLCDQLPLRSLILKRCQPVMGGILSGLLAACALVPPDKPVLAPVNIEKVVGTPAPSPDQFKWPTSDWWEDYHDLQLNQLMAVALSSAPSLQVAEARIAAANAQVSQQEGASTFNVNIAAAPSRQRFSAEGIFPPPIGGRYYTDAIIKSQVQTSFDWWGKRQAALKAAVGEEKAALASYALARNALTASIANRYFSIQGSYARLSVLEQLIQNQYSILSEKNKLFAHHLTSQDDLDQATLAITQSQQQKEQLVALIQADTLALWSLIGGNSVPIHTFRVLPVDLDRTANVKLPDYAGFELLARRPDLQAAHWQVQAAIDRITEAKAAYYPDINLLAYYGLDAIAMGNIFTAASRTMLGQPMFALPLFNQKQLDAELKGVNSQVDTRVADYNRSVFDAIGEVANQGQNLKALQKQLVNESAALEIEKHLYHSVEQKLRQGLIDRQKLLIAQQGVLKEKAALYGLQAASRQSEVALIQALGGGYKALNSSLIFTAPPKPTVAGFIHTLVPHSPDP